MAARVRLTARASRDLAMISERSYRDHGARAAKTFLMGFDRVFRLLADQPYAGQLRDEIDPETRSFSHRPYRILYDVRGSDVLTTRIIHQARDVAAFKEQ